MGVTAVGSTRFIKQSVTQPEMATDQFGSGGGFSNDFKQFKAQASAVAQYLKVAKDLPPAGSFPPTGRATPAVSALGEGFQVIGGGQVQSGGGTSASTPTFASLVGLLNEARLKAGKPAMGHLNPFLYQNPDASQISPSARMLSTVVVRRSRTATLAHQGGTQRLDSEHPNLVKC